MTFYSPHNHAIDSNKIFLRVKYMHTLKIPNFFFIFEHGNDFFYLLCHVRSAVGVSDLPYTHNDFQELQPLESITNTV